MASLGGPNIITNGLVLQLDAANAKSATAVIVQGALQLCTNAPIHTAAPRASARLSIKRAAWL